MSINAIDDLPPVQPAGPYRMPLWQKILFAVGLPAAALGILFLLLWNTFFHYVPPGKMLVVIAKDGTDLPGGQVLADKGQKGILREVRGEGWHFVLPIVYSTKLEDCVRVPPGKVGIVTSLGGVPPRDGRELAERDDEQGIRPNVLTPGTYRLNPYGYKVELVDAVEIKPGYVGVVRRLLGNAGQKESRFAEKPGDKGILREVLQPGLYFVNTKVFEVFPAEVGIDQTTYKYHSDPAKSSAISFPVKDGNEISMECTIEWEVLPADLPDLVAEYGEWHRVEQNVIDQQARRISRDRGFNFGAQDFLEGEKREKFQLDFTRELERVCKEKHVVIRSAFIRNIIIPEAFLKPKREKQLAAETRVTNEAKEKTAQSEALLEKERQMVQQRVSKVQAETAALVALIDRDVENVKTRTDAELERLRSKYQADIAVLEAERTRVRADAETQVTRLKETAKGNLFKLKLDVFGNNAEAYQRYTLAQQLNPNLVLRIFHAGAGTFWTNLEGKGVSLMLPTGSATPSRPESVK